ncbi:ABC transporter permease [Rhizobium sp. CG5]|uniref:ABC transporter permease n=1 Tax=Rhizobium sp. CG5 TaxID=2726076 RepID=UPI002033A8F5|nr:ABC transporter permease [Rhizobium sp. CG5]MCM2475143.1 ABC transporter permease [Rhizobium sp. CG5]
MTTPDTSAISSSSALPEDRETIGQVLHRWLDTPGVLPVGTFVLVVAFWEIACHLFAIPTYMLPAPSRILTTGFSEITALRWLDHVWATLRVALLGYFISIAISLPIAIVLTKSKMLSRALYPILVVVQSTPVVAVAPIIIVVLGSGDAPRIVITCLITFFPLVVSTATGLMATPPELIELSKSLKAPVWREITQIRLPYAVPYIFSALKISITLAVIGAVVAEFVAAEKGIGYFIQFSTSFFKLPQAWAGLGILVLMSLILFQLVALAQKLFFPWSIPKTQ